MPLVEIVILGLSSLIIACVILVMGKFSDKTVVLSLMIIAGWLILYPQLVSPYVMGIDAHWERVVANDTLLTGHWDPNIPNNVANGALSIAILAPTISMITGIPIDSVTKFVFSIYPVITIPMIWRINKRVFNFSQKELILSSLVIIATGSFMLLSALSRQELALFCFMLVLYMVFVKTEKSIHISVITIILMVATIVSHYSTSIILVLLLGLTSLASTIIYGKRNINNYVTLGIVMVILWIFFVVTSTMVNATAGIQSIIDAFINLSTDNTSDVVRNQLDPTSSNPFYLLLYLVHFCIVGLLICGAFFLAHGLFKNKSLIGSEKEIYPICAIVAIGFIGISILPGISLVYNAERIYLTALFVGVGTLIIGMKKLVDMAANLLGKNYHLTTLKLYVRPISLGLVFILVTINFALVTGLPEQLANGHTESKYFTDTETDFHYTLDYELSAIEWIKLHLGGVKIITDSYGKGYLPIESYGLYNKSEVKVIMNVNGIPSQASDYIFYQQKVVLVKQSLVKYEESATYAKIESRLFESNHIFCSKSTNVFS